MTAHRVNRISLSMLHDGTMAGIASVLALYLRVGQHISEYSPHLIIANAGIFAAITLVCLRFSGLYRGIWRYASINDLVAISRAVTIATLVFTLVWFQLNRLESLPRSTLIIQWLVLVGLLSGPRIAYRLFKDRRIDHLFERNAHLRLPVLLIGASDSAEAFIRECSRDSRRLYEIVGCIGITDTRVGRAIRGVPVLGTLQNLDQIIQSLSAERQLGKLIVTRSDLPAPQLREIFNLAISHGIEVARMPHLTELNTGLSDGIDIRPITIEDLLGRSQRSLDRTAMASLVYGRRVLVTGAGGTIGSELVRQISPLNPAALVLLDSSEYQLYLVDMALAESHPTLQRAAYLADIRDRHRIDEILTEVRPELVFHAAAYKHVPMVETNPLEGILTNVIGTRNVAEACRAADVGAMVMISTDKAVHPANVMGATKRLAESICQALDLMARQEKTRTRFITVRFGNVLGSTGSVVPLFRRQLAAGGPLTVTHPDVERYFMTVREAVELVLQAAAMACSPMAPDSLAHGGIFVLEMGNPVKISDLARQMIRLAGLVPDRDIQIDYIGLRPGEKLREELFHEAEPPVPTERDGILLARPRATNFTILCRALDDLELAARKRDPQRALTALRRMVPEFGEPRQQPIDMASLSQQESAS